MTRRRMLAATGTVAAAAATQAVSSAQSIPQDLVRRTEQGAENLLTRQVTDASSRNLGGIADAVELYHPSSVGALIELMGTCFVYEGSKFHKNPLFMERIRLGTDFVMRHLSKEGNLSLLITNFNSPPDTAFFTNPVASVAILARRAKATELSSIIEPLLRRLGQGLAQGGVHTPNHRWVVTSALAQLHELFGGTEYLKRANQWLSEGIDIDGDGQFSERSTTVYNTVSDRGLTMAAIKLNRPELLEPVRRNLDSMMYLLHPDNEVVTEISKRQDKNVRAKPDRYWFPAKYLAARDNNGLYESFAQAGSNGAQLSTLLEYPELQRTVPAKPIPDNYEKVFPVVGLARIRRGRTSATIQFTDADRVFCLRRGNVVMNGIRFASAFFGKGQFLPQKGGPKDGGYAFTQELEGPYYQPLDKPETIILHEQWQDSWKRRRHSEVCRLKQSAFVKEEQNGFSIRLQADGTADVPLAVEISFAPGGELAGCEKLAEGSYLLAADGKASYRAGSDVLHFGPGLRQHRYTDVRGALPRLDGTSVYLTGFTPFDHTISFRWA